MTYKLILTFLIAIVSSQLKAQLLDTIQRSIYKDLSIKEVAKYQIETSSGGVQKLLLSLDSINNSGYIFKQRIYNSQGIVTQLNEYEFSSENLLSETRTQYLNNKTQPTQTTKYTYNNFNQPSSYEFYSGDFLQTSISFKYSSTGLLKSQAQTLYGDPKIGSYSGKLTTKFKYSPEGKISKLTTKETLNGKRRMVYYTYKYSADGKTTEEYTRKGLFHKWRLSEKIVYNQEDKIECVDKYFGKKITTHIGTISLIIEEGYALKKHFIYNSKGLIEQEIYSVKNEQKGIIKYEYK